jgi:hypothetical protein
VTEVGVVLRSSHYRPDADRGDSIQLVGGALWYALQ